MKLNKSEAGQAAFKVRSPLFSLRQRSIFILCDGRKSAAEVLVAAAAIGATQADIDYLLGQGLLEPGAEPVVLAAAAPDVPAAAQPDGNVLSEQLRYQAARVLATQISASMGLRGFMLNLSVESASGCADLLALLPRLQDAAGAKACRKLEQILKG